MSVMTQRSLRLARSADGPAHDGSLPAAREALAPRRRGRPPLATPEQVASEIRAEAQAGRLFRMHLDRPALYARARRMWGSWAAALGAAGVDSRAVRETARQRSLESRRARRARGES